MRQSRIHWISFWVQLSRGRLQWEDSWGQVSKKQWGLVLPGVSFQMNQDSEAHLSLQLLHKLKIPSAGFWCHLQEHFGILLWYVAFTGVVIVNSGEWVNGYSGATLTKHAFSSIHIIGPIVLTLGLLTFVFSTILGCRIMVRKQLNISSEIKWFYHTVICGWFLYYRSVLSL